MQIQGYQTLQAAANTLSAHISDNSIDTSTRTAETAQQSVQLSISTQALQMAQADKTLSSAMPNQPLPLPEKPTPLLSEEKLQQVVKFKKAQMQYQATADMANLLTGNNHTISAAGAYHLSQSEDARQLLLDNKKQQQTMANMQAYQAQTQALNEWYA